MTPNAVLMERARGALAGNWGMMVGISVVYGIVTLAIGAIHGLGFILNLAVNGPLLLGLTSTYLLLVRKQPFRFAHMFSGFNHFGRAAGTYLWMVLFVMLWMLLLIVPGIVAGIAYSQTFYLMADDESLAFRAALKKSRQMMYGHKWKYFCLGCRFIGWALLCVLTLGIGFLWLLPYIGASNAEFYEDLKGTAPAV